MFPWKAVAFDIADLLAPVQQQHPLDAFWNHCSAAGAPPSAATRRRPLTAPLNLAALAEQQALAWAPEQWQQLQQCSAEWLAAGACRDDAAQLLVALQQAGIRWGLCSNASVLDSALVDCLPQQPDAMVWSFVEGVLKPAPQMYQQLCRRLDVAEHELLWLGSRWKEDVEGPRRLGIRSLQLDRSGKLRSDDALHSLAELIKRLG